MANDAAATPAVKDQPAEIRDAGRESNVAASVDLASPADSTLAASLRPEGDVQLPVVEIGEPPVVAELARAPEVVQPSESTAPRLDAAAINVKADELNRAIQNRDFEAVRRLMEGMVQEDRQSVATAYRDKFDQNGPADSLMNAVRTRFSDTQFQQFRAMMERQDGATNMAGQLVVSLTQLQGGDTNALRDIREVFGTLSTQQIRNLDAELRTRYADRFPNGIQSAIYDNPNVPQSTRDAIRILEKGVEARTQEDNMQLARMAVTSRDLNMLGEALRGDHAAATGARTALTQDSAFMQAVRDAFGNSQVAQDLLRSGRISLESIAAANNEGFFGNSNKRNVELALSNAPLEERQRYARGRELALAGTTPQSGSPEATDLDFYTRTRAALEALATGNRYAPDITNPTNPDVPAFLRNTLGITDQDIQNYRDNPSSRAAIDSKVGGVRDENQSGLVRSLLRQLAETGDISQLNSVDRVLYDRVSGGSPQRLLLNAETALQDPETRRRLRENFMTPGMLGFSRDYQGPGGQELRERDRLLWNAIGGSIETLSRATRAGNGLVSAGLGYNTPWMGQLLSTGSLRAEQLAELGFPLDMAYSRLSPNDQANGRQYIDQIYAQREPNRDVVNAEMARYEDQLIRGGSVISDITRQQPRDANSVLTGIENMSQTDWRRLHDPALRDAFVRDVDRTLAQLGMDEALRARVGRLLTDKANAETFDASRDVRRSIVDVTTRDADFAQSLANMNQSDQQRYASDPAFRAQVDQLVQQRLTRDVEQVYARRMLENLARDGRIQTRDQMSPADRVLHDFVTGASPYQTMTSIEAMLQDRDLRRRLNQDQRMHPGTHSTRWTRHEDVANQTDRALADIIAVTSNTIAETARQSDLSGAGFAMNNRHEMTLQRLMDTGSLSLQDKMFAGYPREILFAEIARLPEAERLRYRGFLRMSDRQNVVFDHVMQQGGQMRLEDRVRSFIIQSDEVQNMRPIPRTTYGDFRAELELLSPEQLQQLRSDYARKYGSDFDNDFMSRVEAKDRLAYENILAPVRDDGVQDYFDSLGMLHRSEGGVSPDGTPLTVQRAMQQYAEALQTAQLNGEPLSLEMQQQLTRFFSEALDQYQDSKVELAERLLQYGSYGMMFAATVLAVAASGGTIAPGILTAMAVGGTAANAAVRYQVMQTILGPDFQNGPGNQLRALGWGLFEGGLMFAPVVAPALAARLAEVSAARTITNQLANTTISTEGRLALQQELAAVQREALAAGRPLTQQQLEGAITRANLTAADVTQARSALRVASVNREMSQAVVDAAPEVLDATQRAALAAEGREMLTASFGQGLREVTSPLLNRNITPQLEQLTANVTRFRAQLSALSPTSSADEVTVAMRAMRDLDATFGAGSAVAPSFWTNLEQQIARGDFTKAISIMNGHTAKMENATASLAQIAGGNITQEELKAAISRLSFFTRHDSSLISADEVAALTQYSERFAQSIANGSTENVFAIAMARASNALSPERGFTADQRYNAIRDAVNGSLTTLDRMEDPAFLAILQSRTGASAEELSGILQRVRAEINANLQSRVTIGTAEAGNQLVFRPSMQPGAVGAREQTMAHVDEVAARFTDPAAAARFRDAARQFFSTNANDKSYGFQIIQRPDGHFVFMRVDPSGKPGAKVFMQEIAADGSAVATQNEYHLLYATGADGRLRVVEIKDGTATNGGSNILWTEQQGWLPAGQNWQFDQTTWGTREAFLEYLNRSFGRLERP